MLQVKQFGPVLGIRAARSFFGRGYYYTAAYWLDGLLIDTTCAFTALELLQALPAAEWPVGCIVNTHSHEDHIGANGVLQHALGARIQAHRLALPVLEDPHRQPLQPYRRVFWGWPLPSRGDPLGEWVETEHYRLQVIPTPGHSLDHVALYEPQRGWLFSGDAYIGGRDRAARADYDMVAIIASLRRLAALDLTGLFPGSGTVRMNHPADEIRRKADSLEELGQQARDLHGRGQSVRAIRNRLLGSENNLYYVTLGHFSGTNLIEVLLRPGLSTSGDSAQQQDGGTG